MNLLEQCIFEQHKENIDTKWEDFSKEIMSIQTPGCFSILYATDVHYIRKYAMYLPAYYKVKEMVDFSGYAGFDLFALTGERVRQKARKNTLRQKLTMTLPTINQMMCFRICTGIFTRIWLLNATV